MKLRHICLVITITCCFVMGACRRPGSSSTPPDPPPTSFTVESFEIADGSVSQQWRRASVTPDFFRTSGTNPLLGRLFGPEEYQSDKQRVVVISYRLWEQKFSLSPAVIGTGLRMNGQDFTIIGVMPKSFNVPPGVEAWIPRG